MTLTADTPPAARPHGLFVELTQLLRSHLPRRARADEPPTPEHALVRALCHDMRSPLAALEARLAPLGFVRTHRSWLVNGACVTELRPEGSGDYAVVLGELEAPLSRRFPAALKALRP